MGLSPALGRRRSISTQTLAFTPRVTLTLRGGGRRGSKTTRPSDAWGLEAQEGLDDFLALYCEVGVALAKAALQCNFSLASSGSRSN